MSAIGFARSYAFGTVMRRAVAVLQYASTTRKGSKRDAIEPLLWKRRRVRTTLRIISRSRMRSALTGVPRM